MIDANGIPLAVGLSAANTHDSQLLEQLVDAVPVIIGPRGRLGRPRRRPAKLHADKGYDYPTCRRVLRRRGISPRIARRGVESSQRLGRHRWKVERSLAWLLTHRRLTVRYERRADILTGFVHLACALICARKLHRCEAAFNSLAGHQQPNAWLDRLAGLSPGWRAPQASLGPPRPSGGPRYARHLGAATALPSGSGSPATWRGSWARPDPDHRAATAPAGGPA
jgi:transposase